MKHLLQALVVICLFGLNSFAQQDFNFKLSTDKPEPGKEIRYTFTWPTNKMLNPVIILFYNKGGESLQMGLKGKYSRGRKDGIFVLPDSIQAFLIKPQIGKTKSEGYIFQVYNNGDPMEGAFAATARFYGIARSGTRDVKKSLSLYRKEFAIYPAQKPLNLLDYFQTGSYNPDSLIIDELHRTWQDSVEHGTKEVFLYKLYEIALGYGISGLKEQLRSQLLKKYPKGHLAFHEARKDYLVKNPNGNYINQFQYLEQRFPELVNSGILDEASHNFARHFFKKGFIDSGEFLMNKIRDKKLIRDLYAGAASDIVFYGDNANKAALYIQNAIDMTDGKSVYQQGYHYTSALIHHKLGNLDKALADLKTSLSFPEHGSAITTVYLKYLLEAGKNKIALDVATAYIKARQEDLTVKRIFLESYAKIKGSADGAEEQYNTLMKYRDEQFEVPKYNRLDAISVNFTVKDIYGKAFSLDSLRGKSVILYFFNINGNRQSRDANDYFNKVASEYQSRNDIVFVGIDNSYVTLLDEGANRIERSKLLKNYLERRNITYPVIEDQWISSSERNGGHFKIATDYNVEGRSQFFIIDKNGIVIYKNTANQYISEYFYRELKAALKLI